MEWVVDRALQLLSVLCFHSVTRCAAVCVLPVNLFGIILCSVSSWGVRCACSEAGAVASFIKTCPFWLGFEASQSS